MSEPTQKEKIEKCLQIAMANVVDSDCCFVGMARNADGKEGGKMVQVFSLFEGNWGRVPVMYTDIVVKIFSNLDHTQKKVFIDEVRSQVEVIDKALSKFDGYRPIMQKRPTLEIVK